MSVLHVPSAFGKLITQGALPAAILVAMTVNRRITLRPNVFMSLVTVLLAETLIACLQPQHFGTVYRTFRLGEFVVALWLLTPWWGRRDLLFVRAHLTAIAALLGMTLLGIAASPGRAFVEGRLTGVIWPIPAPQVAHYAAVGTGLTIVLWFGGRLRGRAACAIVAVTGSMLLMTHTRTALAGMVAGIVVAGLSLIVAKARVRRFFAVAGATAGLTVIAASSVLTAWLSRGEGTQQLSSLTGRTTVWGPLLAFPRNKFQEIFGFGLSNSSFNGLAIDSNWLSAYQEQGLFGVAVSAAILIFLLVTAYFQPRGVQRALALFLIAYCLIASFTEDGFTDATSYMLELALAASLLLPSRVRHPLED